MQCVRFDEPIGLPTDLSERLAVRTQQIILYESGVANVADPLGGSYYVEHLTDMLEDEMQHIIDEIDQYSVKLENLLISRGKGSASALDRIS